MFLKLMDRVMEIVVKNCKDKDCMCFTNLTSELIDLDQSEEKRIKKGLGIKDEKKADDFI